MITPPYLINLNTFAGFEDLSANLSASRMAVFVKKMQELDLRLFMGASFYQDFIKWVANSGVLTASIINSATTAANGSYPDQVIVNSSGDGVNATANVIVLNNVVTAIAFNELGFGYTVGNTFTVASIPGASFSIAELSPEAVFNPATPQTYLDLFNGKVFTDKSGHDVGYQGMIPSLIYWTLARFVEVDSVQYTKTGPVIKNHDAGTALDQRDVIKLVQQHRSTANAYCNDIEFFLYNNWQSYPLWRWDQRKKSARQSGPRIRAVDKTDYNAPGFGTGRNPGILGYDFF